MFFLGSGGQPDIPKVFILIKSRLIYYLLRTC
ncbi:hypothetical protein DET0231 [Dehalococcoides mccartyi 195]|uniref:Uncharacterized protein n=1 Tax=Dehalococcoides mccartyi (strain ATCC BAA-2266 / KCTC 15142 / 195) TaxID=243164 RepID=Q3Z9X0_DEHM1|nr:hypothetical protein DET0231 [Dehalococcoides mccartyi 195]